MIDAARERGITLRVLGGAAVCMQAPDDKPLLARQLKDIDLVTTRKEGRPTARLLEEHSYVGDQMFNALHGAHRQLFHDVVNQRQVDVFVGRFSMCHEIPIAERLDQDPFTVPLAELLMTKLQIIELNERDERDIYSLCYQINEGRGEGIEAGVIGELCAKDWGLWRTCKGSIERSQADLSHYQLSAADQGLVSMRLEQLWQYIDATPKSGKWRRRSRLGERKRWYEEPEEVE